MESTAETERLNRQRQYHTADSAERSGETLLDLAIDDSEPGLGGRYLITLVKRNRTLSLPWNRFRVGSPIVLSSFDDSDEETYQGVVSRRSFGSIQTAVSRRPEGDRFRLDLASDEITRKRQRTALQIAAEARGRLAELRKVLLGERRPQFLNLPSVEFSPGLNDSQKQAILHAMSAEDLAVIHGPPGTGKTTTLVELILQSVLREEKVLACAPSNTAVDNLLERLIAAGQNVVRLGHPARVSAAVREHSLDELVHNHENMKIVRDLMRQAEKLSRKVDRYTRAKPAPGARNQMRQEIKQLKADVRMLERQAIDHVLDRADIVCATTTFNNELLGDRHFDLAVIDEACQSTEPGCWIPLLHSQRVVLAGDHRQLPPTVISTEAAREGFSQSLLERVDRLYGDQITRRLDIQYRMHEQIMQFSSERFYEGTLQADGAVKSHLLCDLPEVTSSNLTEQPVTFIDTAGAGWGEEQEPDGESRLNPEEGQLVLRKVQELIDAGLASSDIAVITPYAAQVRRLRENWQGEELEIDTVDGFQGREKEAVIISLVRCNSSGEIGFLADVRRMNVALTRARRKLIVIGDSATIAAHEFYESLLNYFETTGAYHTVWEEM